MRLPAAFMEAQYTALQSEIQFFKEHMRSCRQAFDIHTLYNVLLLLSKDDSRRDIQSLEQLEKLVESREWDGQEVVKITAGNKKCDIPSYISWFVSYVHYLGSLKEAFDTKVVFPLCEELYVNDDPLPLGMLPSGGRKGHATASVAHTAKQLFAMRRKWALLLKGGMIDGQVFSSQSLLDLQGFANFHSFVKIIRLVPDLFHKSLASADLAQQWVELHASKHSSQQASSDPNSIQTRSDTGMDVGSLEHPPGLSQYPQDYEGGWPQSKASNSHYRDTCTRAAIQERNKLNEVHGDLMFLLQREERSWTLEAEVRKLQRSCQELASLMKRREEAPKDLPQRANGLDPDSSHSSGSLDTLSSGP
ncbi:uncharacterized protein LOC129324101 [Eublepharis macularius]|uniref:Uncharacterized protein LOC129324101 n=1 Tax=Eublepharis macularius TaxID=481883 RepID=A0AA97IWU7_EUBMA|nr:uncharacterized protein LOC129324101 [Eublepharis macularius]